MFLVPGLHRFQVRYILDHRHHLRSRHLLDQGIAFLMIAVRVRTEKDLDVGKLESQLPDGFRDGRNISFVRAVDQNVSLRCGDQE